MITIDPAALRQAIADVFDARFSDLHKGQQALNTVMAEQNRLLREIRDRLAGAPGAVPPTAPAPVTPNEPNDPPGTYRSGPGASVRWQGESWSITAAGQVARSGRPATTPDLTANATMIGVDDLGRLVHQNAAGELRYWASAPDWPLIRVEAPKTPVLTIQA